MRVYHFDVQVSDHNSIKGGIVAKRLPDAREDFHRIIVAADNDHEAHLIAAQMAGCQHMVTSLLWRI